jgi:hypothetical protein
MILVWLALPTRRQVHFLELSDSGRWEHYYNHAEPESKLHEIVRLRNQWASIAGISPRERVAN